MMYGRGLVLVLAPDPFHRYAKDGSEGAYQPTATGLARVRVRAEPALHIANNWGKTGSAYQ